MSNSTVYEFPLKEKVRNYLRIEQLMSQLKLGAAGHNDGLALYFFEQLFTLLDLFERIDIRTDILKDLDAHEKNLVHWSQLPNIDNVALQNTLRSIVNVRDKLKSSKKISATLRDDKFLASIRQRFAIPGGTCSFDLPNLHYWTNRPVAERQEDLKQWTECFALTEQAISIALSFLRERAGFVLTEATNGFYQGVSEAKNELVRIRCATDLDYFPTLSGNKYRYAIRFMYYNSSDGQSGSVEQNVQFELAAC
ncbi:MAG: cell division protein ZapD [Alteromonadaceae bacterium]|nr:cell division protein ZapD [Alteromonadaceae bacterium]